MEQLGTPFAWSVFAVMAIAVAAAMIAKVIRKRDETTESFDEVGGGILKQDWLRTGKIDFHVGAPESTSPQRLILRVEEKKIMENSMGDDVVRLRWRLATVDEACSPSAIFLSIPRCFSIHSREPCHAPPEAHQRTVRT